MLSRSSWGGCLPRKSHAAERCEMYFGIQAFLEKTAWSCSAVVGPPLLSFFFFSQRWTLSLWQGIEGALSMESRNYIHCLTTLGAGGKNGLQQLHYLGKKNWSYKLLRKMLLLGVLEKIEQLPIEGKVCEKTPLFLFQWSSNLFRFILPSWRWFELRLSMEWLPHVSLWLGHVVMAWSSQRKTDISSCSGELPLRAGAPQEVSDLWNV